MKRAVIWDLPTRLFHWLLVLCMAGSWITGENGAFDWHMRFGYMILILLLFRLIWGVVGAETARFRHFVRGLSAILRHLRELADPGRLPVHVGHNPLGALAVVGLLGLTATQAVSGLFTSDGILVDGPMVAHVSGAVSSVMRQVHLVGFNILLGIIALHVLAILVYAIWKKRDLVRPMLTGRADLPDDAPVPRMVSLGRATVVAGISIAAIGMMLALS